VGEVISTKELYMSYLSWKLLHFLYEFFHVSDMANATKLPMEFSAAALLYISLAYMPLLSSHFFDVADSLENWKTSENVIFHTWPKHGGKTCCVGFDSSVLKNYHHSMDGGI
jgi:hypothetical protein